MYIMVCLYSSVVHSGTFLHFGIRTQIHFFLFSCLFLCGEVSVSYTSSILQIPFHSCADVLTVHIFFFFFWMWRLSGGDPAGQPEAQPEGICQEDSVPGQPAAEFADELESFGWRSLVPWHTDLSQGQSHMFLCKTVKLSMSTTLYQREKCLTNACSCTRAILGLQIILM